MNILEMSKYAKFVQTKSSKKRKKIGCKAYTKECFDCVKDSLISITTFDHRLKPTYNRLGIQFNPIDNIDIAFIQKSILILLMQYIARNQSTKFR